MDPCDTFKCGNSTFYTFTETPLPITQPANSPLPPPRHRHNPFNKPDTNNSHQRSGSMRLSNNTGPGELVWIKS